MASRKWFEFANPDTGKKEFECPALDGQNIVAGQAVAASGVGGGEIASIARAAVWAALSADARGHKVLPKGVRRTSDPEAFVQAMAKAVDSGFVIDFYDRFNVSFNTEDVDDGDGTVDENPTGTSPESL